MTGTKERALDAELYHLKAQNVSNHLYFSSSDYPKTAKIILPVKTNSCLF
jgi:hypothetical protein